MDHQRAILRQSFDGEALGGFSHVGTGQKSSLVCSMLDIDDTARGDKLDTKQDYVCVGLC